MLRSLRGRFILSHILPVLVSIPLIGIAIIFLLEVDVLIPMLTSELTTQAELLVDLTRDRADLWTDATRTQAFINGGHAPLDARLMLLDRHGVLLASTDPRDAPAIGQVINHTDLTRILSGETLTYQDYAPRLSSEVVDVFVPAIGANGQVNGVVRLSYNLDGVYARFAQLRFLVVGVLIAGVALGATLGYALALNLERPIRQLTEAVQRLTSMQQWESLPEHPPEEIALLIRAMNSLVTRLHSLELARRQLLANMVHELGRPLGALQSATHALRGGADEDEALRRELLAGMDDEIRRLRHVLEDLVSHYDQVLGMLELDRKTFQLNEWLSRMLAPWREEARHKGLQWTMSLPTEEISITADADRLAQAVGNLISNAIKYTHRGGAVSIEVLTERGRVGVRVGDTGPGIALSEQAHIFDPYVRIQAERRFPQGMGLGLTLVREIMLAHGGSVELDSAPGHGSRFTLWLPY
jgi:two-component system sensor histidine kinase BaeS